MKSFFRFHIDLVGFWTSVLCAAHCVTLPLVLVFFSLGSLKAFDSSVIEPVIFSISACIAMLSLFPGYFRHNKPTALFFLIGGFILIGLSRMNMILALEIMAASGGALLVAAAHYINWKLSQSHKAQSVNQ